MKVITFSGKARHGKDTSALLLKEQLELDNKKILIVHFADYLKMSCKEYFGWDGKKDCAGRTILQHIGTDIIRKRHPTFWAEIIKMLISVIQEDYDYIFVPDCRFQDEIATMRNNFDTIAVNVIRLNFENDLTPEQRMHPSETALDGYVFDYVIESESGIDNLLIEVQKFIKFYRL